MDLFIMASNHFDLCTDKLLLKFICPLWSLVIHKWLFRWYCKEVHKLVGYRADFLDIFRLARIDSKVSCVILPFIAKLEPSCEWSRLLFNIVSHYTNKSWIKMSWWRENVKDDDNKSLNCCIRPTFIRGSNSGLVLFEFGIQDANR